MTCRDCRFKKHDAFSETCHRYAARPILVQEAQDNLRWVIKWPIIENPDKECGDFAPAEASVTEPRAQAPAQLPEVVEKPPEKPKPPERPLPSAKEALEMAIDYMTIAIVDYDESELVVDKQTLSGSPEGKVWRIETHHNGYDYNFVIGPDGIVEMY